MLSKSKSFCFLVNVSGMAFLGNPFDKIMTPLLTPFHCGNLPFIKRGWSFIFWGGGGGGWVQVCRDSRFFVKKRG